MRLGVVLLIPPPLDREIDAFRRAVGDGTLDRVPAHLTLVPPVNVRDDRLEDALRTLRDAAIATRSFRVCLGPPTTFLPVNPVLYLPVDSDGEKAIVAVRDLVFKEPLARPLSWPFVPHVTLGDEVAPERITAAAAALADYRTEVAFDRIHMLQEGPGRVWRPIADAGFSAPAVIGTGGLAVALSVTDGLDPEARRFADHEWRTYFAAELGEDAEKKDFAITARRDGRVVGAAEGWAQGELGYLGDLIVAAGERGLGVGSHLLAAFESEAAARGCTRLALTTWSGTRAEDFYRSRGFVEEARFLHWARSHPMVRLRRQL